MKLISLCLVVLSENLFIGCASMSCLQARRGGMCCRSNTKQYSCLLLLTLLSEKEWCLWEANIAVLLSDCAIRMALGLLQGRL